MKEKIETEFLGQTFTYTTEVDEEGNALLAKTSEPRLSQKNMAPFPSE